MTGSSDIKQWRTESWKGAGQKGKGYPGQKGSRADRIWALKMAGEVAGKYPVFGC